MRNFEAQWEVIEAKKEGDDPDTPVISKDLPIIKWVDAFHENLYRCIGVRHVPLAYVVSTNEAVPSTVPPLVPY